MILILGDSSLQIIQAVLELTCMCVSPSYLTYPSSRILSANRSPSSSHAFRTRAKVPSPPKLPPSHALFIMSPVSALLHSSFSPSFWETTSLPCRFSCSSLFKLARNGFSVRFELDALVGNLILASQKARSSLCFGLLLILPSSQSFFSSLSLHNTRQEYPLLSSDVLPTVILISSLPSSSRYVLVSHTKISPLGLLTSLSLLCSRFRPPLIHFLSSIILSHASIYLSTSIYQLLFICYSRCPSSEKPHPTAWVPFLITV